MSEEVQRSLSRRRTSCEKLRAVRRVLQGECNVPVAKSIGVPESTLRNWVKNKEKILRTVNEKNSSVVFPRPTRPPMFSDPALGRPFKCLPSTSGTSTESDQLLDLSLPRRDPVQAESDDNAAELRRLAVELAGNQPVAPEVADHTNIFSRLAFPPKLVHNKVNYKPLGAIRRPVKILPATAAPATCTSASSSSSSSSAHTSPSNLRAPVDQRTNDPYPHRDNQLPVDDPTNYWLKTQQPIPVPQGSTAFPVVAFADLNWRFYKPLPVVQVPLQLLESAVNQLPAASTPPKLHVPTNPSQPPLRFHNQQNFENRLLRDGKRKVKTPRNVRVAPDSLISNDANQSSTDNESEKDKAVKHGEEFLRWMEGCSNPSVSTMQIMQFRNLLNKIKWGAIKKDRALQNATKFSSLEGHGVPILSPVQPGNDILAPASSSPDMDDVSGKRQATRVFKKSSPNGKITVYLGKRDFVDHISNVDPIDGVVLIDPDYVKDRKVFGHVLAAFRYGREDLDVLGLTFRKDLYLAAEQIFPEDNSAPNKRPLTRLQERLIKKLGPNAYPFYFELPPHCPASVTLQPAPGDTGKPCGVDYELKAFVGDSQDDKPHKRNSVRLAIRKIMYAPSKQGEQPSVEVSKEFMMSPNKLYLEASLDKELYHHGENIAVNVHIANNSNRTVKKIKVSVRQFADICLFSTAQYKCTVAEIESDAGCPILQGYTFNKVYYVRPLLANNKDKRGLALDGQLKHEDTNLASSTIEGCPIGPGFTLSKVFTLTPLLANNKDKWGLALDGQLKHEDTNLASSTLVADPSQRENLGIIVQYKVKVKLCLGALGGDLVAELPFILMHPKPEEEVLPPSTPSRRVSKDGGTEVPVDPNLIQLDADENNFQDHDDDIIFEDFARLRLKGGETDA